MLPWCWYSRGCSSIARNASLQRRIKGFKRRRDLEMPRKELKKYIHFSGPRLEADLWPKVNFRPNFLWPKSQDIQWKRTLADQERRKAKERRRRPTLLLSTSHSFKGTPSSLPPHLHARSTGIGIICQTPLASAISSSTLQPFSPAASSSSSPSFFRSPAAPLHATATTTAPSDANTSS